MSNIHVYSNVALLYHVLNNILATHSINTLWILTISVHEIEEKISFRSSNDIISIWIHEVHLRSFFYPRNSTKV